MPEQTYKSAMTTVSARGWRRQEPGRSVLVEQPSLLPRAVEVLAQVNVDDRQLADECRVPLDLFRLATSRTPSPPRPSGDIGSANRARLAVVPQ